MIATNQSRFPQQPQFSAAQLHALAQRNMATHIGGQVWSILPEDPVYAVHPLSKLVRKAGK